MILKIKKSFTLLATFSLLLLNLNVALAVPGKNKDQGLERINFVHYAKSSGARSGAKPTSCYKLMGVKWKTGPVDYVINPSNPDGLSEEFVTTTFKNSAETWDNASSKELFNDTYTTDYSAVYGVRDYKNSIAFEPYSSTSAIAVTSVWYSRVTKEIVEFDQVYNTHFSWGDANIDPTKMDLANIATHELGHAVGMADIYNSTCGEVTMYGYGTEGETKKTTLETPDIQGLQKMYGI